MGAYARPVSIAKLFALLVAVALLFAPAFSRAGEAFAAVHNQHVQVLEAGHCQTPPDSSDQDQAPTKSSCISMCMGIALAPTTPISQTELAPASAISVVPALHLSYLGEIATPPPRRS